MVSRLGILDSYHAHGNPEASTPTESDWLSLGRPMGMSVTSRDSSRDGFRSFGNEIPKLMKMAFSDVEEFHAAFL